ncbi:MAG: carbon-nitrogen hydrolase family protein [Rhodobacteraceae bacterium]|nr:carbon-nitrogen hydrolase family protein [Paracoccaceae bacterium]
MRAALLQLTVSDDPAENRREVLHRIKEAADTGAQFVLTPEVTNVISPDPAHLAAVLQTEDRDETLAALCDAARVYGITLVIGSLALRTDDPDGRYANRSFLIDPQGQIQARYDKIHMFDVEISDAETYRESDRYRPGVSACLADAGFATLGMCICYDMRFPHLARDLAQAGADILTFPSAFSQVTGAAHWEPLLRARAIETGCWVIAPAQTGTHPTSHPKPRKTWGHSMVVDPWGEVRLDAGEAAGVYTVDLNLEMVDQARRRVPALRHDRPYAKP